MSHDKSGARRALLCAIILGLPALAAPATAADWPQAHSDLRADPSVLFGMLPNGMRYAIMHNANPKGAVAMRLSIDAGSMEESDAQQGLAHFLEHMAFRGSRHVPEDQVWPPLQRLGLAFGADANAQTSWTQTQYKFDFPRNDTESIDTGLMRLREIASELTLSQSAMDRERGVVLSEERLRATPAYRVTEHLVRQAVPGTIAASRFPIGKTDVLEHAPVSLIRDFYHAYYRPERATVIVVGDIDAKAIEAKIAERFGDWTGVGPAGADPQQPPPGARGSEAELLVDPGGTSSLVLDWVDPTAPDTKAAEQAELVELLGLLVLQYRLQDLADGPQHPFMVAGADNSRMFHSAELHVVRLATRAQEWRLGLDAATAAVRGLLDNGIRADEVTRVTEDVRATLQDAAATAGGRTSPSLADDLAKSVDEGTVFRSPADDLALAEDVLKGLTPETVTAALRRLMRGHGPLLLLTSPTPIEGGQAAVTAALAAAEKAPLAAVAAEAPVVWPYTSFGVPGTVVDRQELADLQTSLVRFANGVRLTVKPTSFAPGEIEVNVGVGNGRLGLPAHRDSPAWAVDANGFAYGGLKQIGFDDMLRALAGRNVRMDVLVGDSALFLHGKTRPADFATQLQVLAAYVSAPGWRAGAIEQARAAETDQLAQLSGSATGIFERDLPVLLHDGDRRWSSPSLAEVAALEPDAFKRMLEAQLDSTPIEVTVVGDITVDRAVREVAATFGALPERQRAKAPADPSVRFPAATAKPVELHHTGRADQGVAVIAWPTTDAFDTQSRENLTVLREVFRSRVVDQLRSQAGATYTPSAMTANSKVFPGYGYFLVVSELPEAKMPLFFSVTESIAADLTAHPISADELERARNPLVARAVDQHQTNGFWLYELTGAQADPRRLDILRAALPDLKRVTAADVQSAAQSYLVDARAWKAEIVPQPAPQNAH